MVPDPAVGVSTTQTRTGVLALSVDARLISGTVSIDLTLWSAVRRRPDHLWQAVTLTPSTHRAGRFTVGPTRVGVAGVLSLHRFRWRWWSSAADEGVTNVALVADTQRDVVCNLTVGVGATQAGAWINAVEVSALLGGRAVSVDDTFWSTSHIRIAKIVWDALTRGSSVPFCAHSVGATG